MAAELAAGLEPMRVALAIFAVTYVLIVSDALNRAVLAGIGAVLMILCGVLTQAQAVAGIDFNALGLLTAMMIIVGIAQKSGMFQYVAIVAAQRVRADPWRLLLMLAVVTALFSAVLDNVTTVLLLTPVALRITAALGVPAYPYLFALILSSNIGGTATLIGDPPNIMIGSAAHLGFNDFLLHLAPAAAVSFVATLLAIRLLWGARLHADAERRARVMAFEARTAISDRRLLRQSLLVIVAVVIGFLCAGRLQLEAATVAASGAVLLLTLQVFGKDSTRQREQVALTLGQVEWVTLFFFTGLFVIVAGVEQAGALRRLADWIIARTQGSHAATTFAILWVSALLSSVVDNIPFVATMIRVIHNMSASFSAGQLQTLWWALSLGACLGGNGTLIGASANVVVAGIAERSGQRVRFATFLLHAFPLMLLSIAISSVYLYLRYLQ